jgi:Uma2 family endonuclease
VDDSLTARLPATAATLAGFCTWARSDGFRARGRLAFIDEGIWIDMSPEEYQTHGLVKAEVARVLLNLNREAKLGAFFPDRTLLRNDRTRLATEPDGVFALWERLRAGRVRLMPRSEQPGQATEVRGIPDWVLEVVSDSSVRKDTQ